MEEKKQTDQQEEAIEKILDEPVEEAAEEAEEFTKEGTEAVIKEDEKKASKEESEEALEKKGLFGKKKKDKKEHKIEELTDQLKRQMAEFDNFRKRTDKEKSMMYEIGAKEVIEKMLPIVDNFERGLAAVPKEAEENSFIDGMQMVYKQLAAALEELGVTPIETVGQEFNPDIHNAVMHVDDEEAGENIIVEEFQKGYTYKDNVIRHSMVKVAN